MVNLQYRRGQLQILVKHARNLALLGAIEPSPYAKLYLLPDAFKKTKRKTRVCKKTCHPSFMEQVRMKIELLISLLYSKWTHLIFPTAEFVRKFYCRLVCYEMDSCNFSDYFFISHEILFSCFII